MYDDAGRPADDQVADHPPVAAARPHLTDLLLKRRYQLIGAVLLGVLLPALVRWNVDWFEAARLGATSSSHINNTVYGALCATVLGFMLLRHLRSHPGVESASYVIYAFGTTYILLGLTLFLLRLDYSRYQIFASFLIVVLWFLFVRLVVEGRRTLEYAVLPEGRCEALPEKAGIVWTRLTSPALEPARFSGVVVDMKAEHGAEWERLVAQAALVGLPVYDCKEITESMTGRVDIRHLSENTMVTSLHTILYARVKRVLDFAVALAALPAFVIAIAVAALMIRLEGSGPVIFTQLRPGRGGKPFTIFKLRTMRPDAAANGDFTRENDPRITKVGQFLRKYRVDEFPQIFNILAGHMSWIGPRPEPKALADWYEREIPYYSYRHIVRPGLTGWAQVNQGNVAEIDDALLKLQYDFYYIKHLSPWLDLLVTVKTVGTVLTGFGSR